MWKVEENFVVRLGGTRYINTPNLVVVDDVPLFRLRRSDEDGMLGIDFDVFNAQGKRVATFAKSVVVQGDKANYDVQTGHETYTVTERSSGRVIARVQRRNVEGAELDVHVHTYLPDGFLLDAGPDGTNLPGFQMIGGTISDCPGAIGIFTKPRGPRQPKR